MSDVSRSTTLAELGVDSLSAGSIAVTLSESYGTTIDRAVLLKSDATIGQIADHVAEETNTPKQPT